VNDFDPFKIWTAVLGELELQISPANFSTWVKPCKLLAWDNSLWTIGVPNGFCKIRIETKYQPLIEKILSASLSLPTKIACKIYNMPADTPNSGMFAQEPVQLYSRPAPPPASNGQNSNGFTNRIDGIKPPQNYQGPSISTPEQAQPQMQTQTRPNRGQGLGLVSRYSFANFVVGDNSKLAHAAAIAVAEHPGEAYNPLFLYGGVGLGKTHLMHAIARTVAEKYPDAKILYETSEKFTNELITSIRNNQTEQFRQKYRNVNVLLIDDIQFIAGKESTQEEFFHTFNAIYESGNQVVLSSDRPPKAIPTLEARLQSRFAAGLTADIQKANYETRVAILTAKAKNLNIPAEALNLIADRVTSNIRELEGALNRVVTHCKVHNLPYTTEVVESILTSFKDSPVSRRVSLDKIINEVAAYYSIDKNLVLGTSRKKEYVLPRQISMYLMRSVGKSSLNQIGAEFGGKDHTTVLHSCDKIEKQLQLEPSLKNDLEIIEQKLYT
jgi:chromosomal replication initiator protein